MNGVHHLKVQVFSIGADHFTENEAVERYVLILKPNSLLS